MNPYELSGYKALQNEIRDFVISPALEVIENLYPDKNYSVELTTSELNSICPKTGLPDFAKLTIQYTPNLYLVEEKSLKLYINAYRSIGIFQEHATNKIFEDFIKTVQPRKAYIKAEWNNRGGISVVVEARYPDVD